MWDLIDSNVELFMYLVKGVRFGTCRPNVSVFFFFKFNVFYSRIYFVEYSRHLCSDEKKKKKIKENRIKTTP